MSGQKVKSRESDDSVKRGQHARLSLIEDILIGLLMASTLLLFSLSLNSHFTLPKLTVFSFLVGALLLVFLYRLKIGEYQVLPLPIRLPLLLLVIWWLLGTVQAIHPQTALDGQYGRYNGLLTNLLLVTMFVILASSRFDLARLRRFLSVMLVLIVTVCVYAFIQYLGIDQMINLKPGSRPVSSIGNPVALATILLLAMPLLFADFLSRNKRNQKIAPGVALLLILLTFFLTGSRGPLLGLVAGVVTVLAVYLYLNPALFRRIKPAYIASAIVLAMLIAGLGIYLLRDRLSPGVAVEMRLIYFDVARQMILDSPVFGYGFESFRLAYPVYRPLYDAKFAESATVVTPTMVHNDYLQLAADNGLPAMLFYLLIISGLVWLIFRALRTDREMRVYHAGILVMLTAYLVQGMTGWLEAASSIIFWLFLGVATSFVLHRVEPRPVIDRTSSYIYMAVVSVGLVVAGIYAYRYSIKMIEDHTLREAQYYSRVRPAVTDEKLSWLSHSAEDDAYYQDQIGLIYMKRLSRQPSISSYRLARDHFLKARELNEYDPYIRFHLIKTDALAIRAHLITKPTATVLEDMNEIMRMDPNNPTVYQVRAELYAVSGKSKQARENLDILKRIEVSRNKKARTSPGLGK